MAQRNIDAGKLKSAKIPRKSGSLCLQRLRDQNVCEGGVGGKYRNMVGQGLGRSMTSLALESSLESL